MTIEQLKPLLEVGIEIHRFKATRNGHSMGRLYNKKSTFTMEQSVSHEWAIAKTWTITKRDIKERIEIENKNIENAKKEIIMLEGALSTIKEL